MNRMAIWALTVVLSSACFAQSSQTSPALPDGGARQRLVSIFIPNFPNAPFTATVNTEWVRALSNGARITLVNHRLVARDSVGRIFQERRWLVPQNGKEESVVTETDISDPVLKQIYICIPQEQTCRLEFRQPFVNTNQSAERASTTHAGNETESLGTQTIAGVETIGTRETTIIAAGEIGNDSPISTKREFWYAPKLGFDLISVRDDPRFGMQRFEVSDLVLGEPDAKLFSPPEEDKILDLRNVSASKARQE